MSQSPYWGDLYILQTANYTRFISTTVVFELLLKSTAVLLFNLINII